MKLTLSQSFSSGHLYQQKNWSIEKQKNIFGKCYGEYGHGHDYIVFIQIEIENYNEDDVTQYQNQLDQIVTLLDHKHLNFEIIEFKNENPTTENLCLYFYQKLNKVFSRILKVSIQEGTDYKSTYIP